MLWLCGGVVLWLCGAVVLGVMCLANCGRRYSLYPEFGVSASTRSNFCCICDSCADDHVRESPQTFFGRDDTRRINLPLKLDSESLALMKIN